MSTKPLPLETLTPSTRPTEQAVLGGLMLDNSTWDAVADQLTVDDFQGHDHRLIFAALAGLAKDNQPIDAVMIAEQLDQDGLLAEAGGLEYLSKLSIETPSVANIGSYAEIVRDHARVRRIKKHALRIATISDPDGFEAAVNQLSALGVKNNAAQECAFITLNEAQARVNAPYAIKNVIACNSVGALVAASCTGKSFLIADMAAHCATGKPWFGHRTHAMTWLIVALEGFAATQNRLFALRQEKPSLADAPVLVTDFSLNLLDSRSVRQFIHIARPHAPGVIAIDTLSAACAGLAENESQPMSAVLANVRRIRDELQCSVILIHHLGKDATKGARGHSSFYAALDSELSLEVNGDVRTLKATKQRDFESGQIVAAFKLKTVQIGFDADGDAVTSCVIEPTDSPPPAKALLQGKAQRQLLAAIHARNNPGKVWTLAELREVARETGMTKSTARSAAEALAFTPFFSSTVGGYHCVD